MSKTVAGLPERKVQGGAVGKSSPPPLSFLCSRKMHNIGLNNHKKFQTGLTKYMKATPPLPYKTAKKQMEFGGRIKGSNLTECHGHGVSSKLMILITFSQEVYMNVTTKFEVNWTKSLGGVRSNMNPSQPAKTAKMVIFMPKYLAS